MMMVCTYYIQCTKLGITFVWTFVRTNAAMLPSSIALFACTRVVIPRYHKNAINAVKDLCKILGSIVANRIT